MRQTRQRARKPIPMTFSVADRLSLTGQRLRANEPVCVFTFMLARASRREAERAARRTLRARR